MTEVMTKAKFKAGCDKEGIKCAYSGHSKTFYVSAIPSGLLLQGAEAMGFSVVKNK